MSKSASKKKKSVNKVKKPAAPKVVKPRKDPRLEATYEEAVTFTCPKRGLVTQMVKVKRYKPITEQKSKHLVVSINELIESLDEKDDGLSIYSDGEELGLSSRSGESE
jgi:hypothetical protein